MDKLNVCPFCGKDVAEVSSVRDCEECANFESEMCPEFEKRNEVDTAICGKFIVCNFNRGGCGASSGWYPTVEEAVVAWNKRAVVTLAVKVVGKDDE